MRLSAVVSEPRVSEMVLGLIARFRVTIGFTSAVFVLWLAEPTGTSLAVGTSIAVLGELLRIWGAGHLNKSREVTSSGPYRWLAHPLYAGSSVIGAGLAVASDSVVVTVIVGVYLAVTLTAAIKSEEAFLRRMFGDRYDRYRRRGHRRYTPPLQPGARVRQPRASRGHRPRARRFAAGVEGTYNRSFWRAAGTRFVKPGG